MKYHQKHRHKWRMGSYGGDTIEYRCVKRECKATFKRKDRKMIRRMFKRQSASSNAIHRVYHEFEKRFNLGAVKHSDYSLMTKVGGWATKYPQDVVVTGCDDTHFSSSDLVIIAHRNKKKSWMGLTVVGLMQNDNQEPFEFFLYPGHVHGLMKALKHFEAIRKSCVDRRNY